MTYILGTVHLMVTVFTDFKYGLIKLIPLRIHGFIELIVAIALITSPLILRSYAQYSIDKFFFNGFDVAVLLVWAITDYSPSCR